MANLEQLLQACIQDLHAARRLAVKRLPGIAEEAGPELVRLLAALWRTFTIECGEFESLGLELEGPENLWMAGIVKDAERDCRSIVRGPLLDVALIGAVRKGIAADGVSLETAVQVAQSLGSERVAGLLAEMRNRNLRSDEAFRRLLHEVASREPGSKSALRLRNDNQTR